MRKINPTLVPQDLTVQEIVDVDINVITTDNAENDEEILESVRSDKDEETNGDDSLEIMEVFDEPIDKPTQTEIGNALETLPNLSLFNKSRVSPSWGGLGGDWGDPPHCFDPKMPILSFSCSFWSFCPNCPPTSRP